MTKISKPILKVEYLIDDDKMSDDEYYDQPYKEFVITEQMLYDLVSEFVELKEGETIDSNTFFVNRI